MRDERGKPVSRWDGHTMKLSLVTGEVPDETARVPEYQYVNPRTVGWPATDFIIGNPPFVGNKLMRIAMGDGYVSALRTAHPSMPDSCDFVMYWWNTAANLVGIGAVKRAGLITTKSITQVYNRRVVRAHLSGKNSVSLAFAIPNHLQVDAAAGADVRIAMTVTVSHASVSGRLQMILNEEIQGDGTSAVKLSSVNGKINEQLQVGPDVASAKPLRANERLCWQGCKLVGSHFQITPELRERLWYINRTRRKGFHAIMLVRI